MTGALCGGQRRVRSYEKSVDAALVGGAALLWVRFCMAEGRRFAPSFMRAQSGEKQELLVCGGQFRAEYKGFCGSGK